MTFLAANGEFDAGSAFGYLERHAIPGVERLDPSRRQLTRSLPSADGPVPVILTLSSRGVQARRADGDNQLPLAVIRPIRTWFDLDADLGLVAQVLDLDPTLAAIGRAVPGLRVTGYPDGFEAAVTTVLGQQVSVRAAGTFAGRLSAAFGAPGPAGLTSFPEAPRLAEVGVEELRAAIGVTGSRAHTLHAVAELFAAGFELVPNSGDTAAAVRPLLALPGIGPWTVEYLAMRVLHDPDACPASDLVLRRALGLDKPREVLRRAEAWRPYRAYATMRLWTAAVTDLPIPNPPEVIRQRFPKE